jgi:F-type H+-transporting ATPase subunit epsilon
MRVSVVSPEQMLFEGDATAVVVPAYDGLVGILPRHAPFLSLLGSGILTVRGVDGAQRLRVAGGFVQVKANVVRIVAESAAAA